MCMMMRISSAGYVGYKRECFILLPQVEVDLAESSRELLLLNCYLSNDFFHESVPLACDLNRRN